MLIDTHQFRLAKRTHGAWRHTALDALPVAAALAHLGFVVWIVAGFAARAWWANALCGLGYGWAIAWNINGISHNFIHTPYFRRTLPNRLFAVIESMAIGFSQTIYRAVHLAHHVGNGDRPDADGATRDPLSIYRHGHDGAPEPLWRYVVHGALRDDMPGVFADMARKHPDDARWARIELAAFAALVAGGSALDWRAVAMLVPCWFLGQALSQLSGYYEHLNGNPDEPMAWGVSSYQLLYNLIWFGNGYHAEHHFRPGVHWTRLGRFHRAIAERQRAAGVHNIGTSHLLGAFAATNRRARASR
jgi:fatty acid desaturase